MLRAMPPRLWRMTRIIPSESRGLGIALLVATATVGWSGNAHAAGEGASADEPRNAAEGGSLPAKQHFERALSHYREGHYRAAIAELEAALNLDPASKDLLFNLAVVHEKLGDLDQAIAALERFAELESDPGELRKARLAIARMRGAREELSPPAIPPRVPMPPPTVPVHEPKASDPWPIAATALAVAATATGVLFGIQALILHADARQPTGPNLSVADLRDRQDRAEASARVADIAFAIGLASGAAAAVLWIREPCPGTAGGSGWNVAVRGVF